MMAFLSYMKVNVRLFGSELLVGPNFGFPFLVQLHQQTWPAQLTFGDLELVVLLVPQTAALAVHNPHRILCVRTVRRFQGEIRCCRSDKKPRRLSLLVVSNDAVMTETLKRTDVQLYAVMLQDVEIGFFCHLNS